GGGSGVRRKSRRAWYSCNGASAEAGSRRVGAGGAVLRAAAATRRWRLGGAAAAACAPRAAVDGAMGAASAVRGWRAEVGDFADPRAGLERVGRRVVA